MTPSMERHLIELGILPPTELQALESVSQALTDHCRRMAKGFFDDPRDENREVPF